MKTLAIKKTGKNKGSKCSFNVNKLITNDEAINLYFPQIGKKTKQ